MSAGSYELSCSICTWDFPVLVTQKWLECDSGDLDLVSLVNLIISNLEPNMFMWQAWFLSESRKGESGMKQRFVSLT